MAINDHDDYEPLSETMPSGFRKIDRLLIMNHHIIGTEFAC